MMSDHGANPIFFNNNKKTIGCIEHFLYPLSPLRLITSHFCLIHPPTLKVDVICVSPFIIDKVYNKSFHDNLSHLRDQKFKHGFNDSLNPICSCALDIETTEAVTRGILLKKAFLKISQISQGNTCARFSF